MRLVGATVSGRIGRTFAAHGLNQTVNILLQLLTLPLLIRAWGPSMYRDWLFLFAVPSFFTLADLGFGLAIGSEVGRLWAADRLEEASEIYEAGWTVVFWSCALLGAGFIAFVYLAPVHSMLHISVIGELESRNLLVIMLFPVIFAQLLGVLRSVYRAHGLESVAVTLFSLNGIGLFLSVVITSIFRLTPYTLAFMNLGVSLTVLLLMWWQGRVRVPWLKPRFRKVKFADLKPILVPGLGMNLLSLSWGLSIQGTFLAVGSATSSVPMLAVVFSSTRTMTRVITQFTKIVESTFLAEFSTAIGSGKHDLAKRLHHRGSQLTFWIALLVSLGLLFVGKPLYQLWTHREMQFNQPLFLLLLLAAVVNGAYFGSTAAPMAVNKHFNMSVFYAVSSAISVGLCWVLSKAWGLVGAGVGVLALEVCMFVYVVGTAIKIVGGTWGEWFRAAISPNFGWVFNRLLRKRRAAAESA